MKPTLLLLVSNREQHKEKIPQISQPISLQIEDPLMQHSLCLIKFSNPRPDDPPYPNKAICTFALLSVPSPSSFFPLYRASKAFSSLFLSCSAEAIFPSSPTWLPGGRTGKQNKRITRITPWETVIGTTLLLQTSAEGEGAARAQEKPEGGRQGFEGKAETFDGSKNAVREAPRDQALLNPNPSSPPAPLCTAQGSHRASFIPAKNPTRECCWDNFPRWDHFLLGVWLE